MLSLIFFHHCSSGREPLLCIRPTLKAAGQTFSWFLVLTFSRRLTNSFACRYGLFPLEGAHRAGWKPIRYEPFETDPCSRATLWGMDRYRRGADGCERRTDLRPCRHKASDTTPLSCRFIFGSLLWPASTHHWGALRSGILNVSTPRLPQTPLASGWDPPARSCSFFINYSISYILFRLAMLLTNTLIKYFF